MTATEPAADEIPRLVILGFTVFFVSILLLVSVVRVKPDALVGPEKVGYFLLLGCAFGISLCFFLCAFLCHLRARLIDDTIDAGRTIGGAGRTVGDAGRTIGDAGRMNGDAGRNCIFAPKSRDRTSSTALSYELRLYATSTSHGLNSGVRAPAAAHAEGGYTEGGYTEGGYTEGGYTDGRYPEGRFTCGHYTEGDSTDGRYPEGRFTCGHYTEGDSTDGRYPEGRFTEGRRTEGQPEMLQPLSLGTGQRLCSDVFSAPPDNFLPRAPRHGRRRTSADAVFRLPVPIGENGAPRYAVGATDGVYRITKF